MSNHIKTQSASPKFMMRTIKQTVTSARRLRANQTPRNVMTRHVRHMFTQVDQTKPKIFLSHNQFYYFVYIFPFIRIRYIKTITINTHIDCLNNSKCSVRDILLATKQGAFESVFGTFSVRLTGLRLSLELVDC